MLVCIEVLIRQGARANIGKLPPVIPLTSALRLICPCLSPKPMPTGAYG